MTIEIWLAFIVASAALLLIPGPTILTVISYSMAHGKRANIPLVIAVTLGDSTALFVSLAGLGAVLSTSVFWFTVVKVVGGLYLLYLGVKLLFSNSSATNFSTPGEAGQGEAGPGWKLFINTYLVTALNPKGIVFFVAFLPQFVSPAANTTQQLWMLGVTFVVLAGLNATFYALFATSARKFLSSSKAQQRFNLFGGALLSGAGIWALLARRPA